MDANDQLQEAQKRLAVEAAEFLAMEETGALGFALRVWDLCDKDQEGALKQTAAAELIGCSQSKVSRAFAALSKVYANGIEDDLDPDNEAHRRLYQEAMSGVRKPKAPKDDDLADVIDFPTRADATEDDAGDGPRATFGVDDMDDETREAWEAYEARLKTPQEERKEHSAMRKAIAAAGLRGGWNRDSWYLVSDDIPVFASCNGEMLKEFLTDPDVKAWVEAGWKIRRKYVGADHLTDWSKGRYVPEAGE